MIRPSTIVSLLACGIALGIGLPHQPIWAQDEMKAPHSESRVGGQAGQPYEQAIYKDESAHTKDCRDRMEYALADRQATLRSPETRP